MAPAGRPWSWEGNVQSCLVTWLSRRGYLIRSVADTATRATGKDIIAETPGGRLMWVSVKGYPENSVYTQARHWLAGAVFDMARYLDENPEIERAIALPGGFATYANLIARLGALRVVCPFRIFVVTENGSVEEA